MEKSCYSHVSTPTTELAGRSSCNLIEVDVNARCVFGLGNSDDLSPMPKHIFTLILAPQAKHKSIDNRFLMRSVV